MRIGYMVTVVAGLLLAGPTFACDKPIGPEDFCGTYRADQKTSFYKTSDGQLAQFEHYDDLRQLLGSLPSDQQVRDNRNWRDDPPASRTEAEAHNVEVTGYIVAVKPGEADRDLHVIVSNAPSGPGRVFMNVEVSGLPLNHVDQSDFERARREIRAIVPAVANAQPGQDYIRLVGAKVLIRGSLFFDGFHGAGCGNCPGPSYAKPRTVWEIHPVYSITAAQ